jgi:hypothetical protein
MCKFISVVRVSSRRDLRRARNTVSNIWSLLLNETITVCVSKSVAGKRLVETASD